ncbi:ser/Thr protein phosphatase family protein-like protein [Macrophomina phaseolina]|uniref:Ser/Thr protein phosphatase family protein-like protein n=1 Tax=Macrophomina phaseolina TaxID=35725 RepID=A0ABQ8GPF9_9PEZI|nr:ser/Thr protein phosphatase family protein-like protein [Macrophomina phaseolina]
MPSSPATIKTRILILADTHNAPLLDLSSVDATHAHAHRRTKPFRAPLPRSDVLLHCGDLTMLGHPHEYAGALAMLAAVDAPLKLVIAGNHDMTLDADFYLHTPHARRWHRDKYDPDLPRRAREMWTGEAARRAGVTYLDEGVREFVLANGARLKVYASPWQPEFQNWAFNYPHNEDRWNPPHLSHKDARNTAENPDRLDATKNGNVGCPHLLRAVARARPRLHAWGHIHEAWGVERVDWLTPTSDSDAEQGQNGGDGFVEMVETIKFDDSAVAEKHAAFVDVSSDGRAALKVGEQTLMVNASIMDLQYNPYNAPVLVDLDLRKAYE